MKTVKILIGTPIHQVKDYSMERWLENVAGLEYPADLFLVDNSPTTEYVKQVRQYCHKHHIKKYAIKHLCLNQSMTGKSIDYRVWASEEVIRQRVLAKDYDAWFSWECDLLIPTDALNKMVKILKSGILAVAHNSWMREHPHWLNFDMGCTLISRKCLKNYKFLPDQGPGQWQGEDEFYKFRILKGGGSYAEVRGLIDPVYHLSK